MLHNPKAKITARLIIALYVMTLAALAITTFYPVQVEDVSVALILSVKLIPLLLFAVPVFRAHNRGIIWMSFVVIFYFTQYVVSAWLSEGAAVPVAIAILTFLLFTVSMFHLKLNRISAEDAT
ncbi:DUF2069 domain-containing protein [Marinobacter confluentis]|uniref:DUF2069 domain-containing protein n=1 Tax=Marinobacter confluentis TaxID=1697557 RepID=A0A4Z1C8C7_9GAMM|nr:DUF2069 domain-containing protein [Marinobacter confluentis]TGN41970.1 DUF2069 domain-containing protein [Marinobacter confluentis]